MDTSGTVTVKGRTYEISGGTSWFDRQRQNLTLAPDGKPLNGKWAWMDLNPDNGDRISLWSADDVGALDAELEVTPFPREQELAPNQVLACYEAASSVRGTYRGKETTGYSYVELVGRWN
ncbi:hypothetical protein [Streptomyces sp. NPDC020951]|uniref:hypothetical protein n=1 Tax=Streptomyces sp. NPDC020951 TaxID=3365104 RepID=UPI00378C5DA9